MAALNVQRGEHVLDLCCAPGAKLAMIAGLIGQRGSATGVDISKARLNACRTLLRKYRLQQVRLFEADGTTFRIPPPSSGAADSQRAFYSTVRVLSSNSPQHYDKVDSVYVLLN